MTVETMFINSDDELLREFVYKSFLQKNPSQDTYFRLILSKRLESFSSLEKHSRDSESH